MRDTNPQGKGKRKCYKYALDSIGDVAKMDPIWNVIRTFSSKSIKRIGIDCYGTGIGGLALALLIGKNVLRDYALLPTFASLEMHSWWAVWALPVALFFGIPVFGFVLNVMHMLVRPNLPVYLRIPLLGGICYLFFLACNQNGLPILPFWLDMPVADMGAIAGLFLLGGILVLGVFVNICGRFFASPLDTEKQGL